jgi:hypothetical protein
MEEVVCCYICYDPETAANPYLKNPKPCKCKGSILIHKDCLDTVIKTSRNCSICKAKYNLKYLPNRNGLELITEVAINGDITEYTVNGIGEEHGEHTVKKSTGELVSICHYDNGELHGKYQTWYPNGQLECECECKHNRITGVYKSWYENGTMMEESVYNKRGLKDGLSKKWDREGNLIISRVYIDGELPLPPMF